MLVGDAVAAKPHQGWASGSLCKGSIQSMQEQQQNPSTAVTVETERESMQMCACVWGENWEELQEQACSGLFYIYSYQLVLLYPVFLQFLMLQMGIGNNSNSSSVQKVIFLLYLSYLPFLNRWS